MSPRFVYAVFGGLVMTNVLTLVGFLMSPDIATLLSARAGGIGSAYEQRVATLRLEIDRLRSRQYAEAGDINLQIGELARQQELLVEQHHFVKVLAARAEELGIRTAMVPDAGLKTAAFAHAPLQPSDLDIGEAGQTLGRMTRESGYVLSALSTSASDSAGEIVHELKRIGVDIPSSAAPAIGGPYETAGLAGESPGDLSRHAGRAAAALRQLSLVRDMAALAPIRAPVAGDAAYLSSGYGTRNDPFLNRPAFHAGLDFAAAPGTPVVSAGSGTVTFTGSRPGYGNVIEIDHLDGFVSRYAHLASILVKEGQAVPAGTAIARVGSTGRSTGPHLHFEIRRKDAALNPARFLAAGDRLAHLL